MLNQITAFFSIETIAFTILDYPMSYIEFIGTIFYLWSVWLIARKNILTWLIGIISVIIYFFLFYQIRLYSDAIEQIYYLGASIYGWWYWIKGLRDENDTQIIVRISSRKTIGLWAAVTLIISVMTGIFISRIHLIFPSLFPEPASYPFLDALTTVMSFSAMFLMAQKRIESWCYWIIVDVIGIWLYYTKGVKFISLLYVILLIMAINGLITWYKGIVRRAI